jgi:hypothetical protein
VFWSFHSVKVTCKNLALIIICPTVHCTAGLNTSYLTDSYIVFTLKMESVSKTTIYGLTIMVICFLKFLHAEAIFFEFILLRSFVQSLKFSNKNNDLTTWRDVKMNFSRPLFTIIFRPNVILDPDSNLRVKTMYESVK